MADLCIVVAGLAGLQSITLQVGRQAVQSWQCGVFTLQLLCWGIDLWRPVLDMFIVYDLPLLEGRILPI